jgi:hypothetical protein
MLELCESVHKADTQLVFWHENGMLRDVLSHIGVNMETTEIVSNKTKKLKAQVNSVELKFSSTSRMCTSSLERVQLLNRRVNDYRTSGIGAVHDSASKLLATYETQENLIASKLHETEGEYNKITAGIARLNAGVDRTKEARNATKSLRNSATAVSICATTSRAIR